MARVYGEERSEQKEKKKKKQQIEKRKLKAGTRSEQGFGSSEEERVVGFFQVALDLQRNQEYARFPERMGDNHQGSRVVGYKGGQIVEVEGGHIVRSTGRKDRHSKVCTAKGPRDRRVRLSAHTAIQFYDVQDRLGYDRPSKAVDWLIKKAKAAIDELAELPAWQPTTQSEPEQEEDQQNQQSRGLAEQHVVSSSSSFGFQNPSSNFLPPSLDSDSIADTIKSFFPAANPSTTQFQNYQSELLSRTNSQDLCLSLQSFHDPILLHHSDTTALNHQHHRFSTTAAPPPTSEHALFSTVAFGEDAVTGAATAAGGGIGFWSWNNTDTGGFHVYNSPPQFAQNQFFTQRGPLQSSHSPSVRARTPPVTVADQHALTSLISAGFSSGGFSGFQIPARIQGEEEQDAVVNRPSSASSASRH